MLREHAGAFSSKAPPPMSLSSLGPLCCLLRPLPSAVFRYEQEYSGAVTGWGVRFRARCKEDGRTEVPKTNAALAFCLYRSRTLRALLDVTCWRSYARWAHGVKPLFDGRGGNPGKQREPKPGQKRLRRMECSCCLPLCFYMACNLKSSVLAEFPGLQRSHPK